MRWYDRAIPQINDVMPYIKEAAKSISAFAQVKNVYVWGGIAENVDNASFRVKDIDILIECGFDSGDLLAIDSSSEGALKIASSELEDLGFNPSAVRFTSSLLKMKAPSVDFWAVSKDQKLLHWGPITETVEEWKQVRKEAESKAEIATGVSKKDLHRTSEAERRKWHEAYEQSIHDFSEGCPQGWYASQNNVDKVFEKAIKLT
jgi:hypothetical protein